MIYVIQVCWQLASRIRMFHPDPTHKLWANLYEIYHCCVCSEKLLMMEPSETCRVLFQNKFVKSVHLFGFVISNYTDSLYWETTPVCHIPAAYSGRIVVSRGRAGRPARPRPTALLSPRSEGKSRSCYCNCWAPDDGRENARNMLSGK
jgi:hypothetical protein